MSEPSELNEDGGRIAGCPCCGCPLSPAKDALRTAQWDVAFQGSGMMIFFVCPRCSERLIGSLPFGQMWEETDPSAVVWYLGGNRNPAMWGS